eukprot:comp19677_c2_seq1/m.23333 comp19677_c2_seq1/g.23333  ORF comp19677_c2_seq1/g.23333 comp19677_c2_seq1/m.23333 type:complete len:295 (-) comp19677_c2_seq1:462-1346(-)
MSNWGGIHSVKTDASGQFLLFHFVKSNTQAILVCNSADGSRENLFAFTNTSIADFMVAGGMRLITLYRDDRVVTAMVAMHMLTGEVMWRTEFDRGLDQRPSYFSACNEEVFVGVGGDGEGVVFDLETGLFVHKTEGTRELRQNSQDYYFLVTGKQLSIIVLRNLEDYSESEILEMVYQSWDETGAVDVPLTTIDLASEYFDKWTRFFDSVSTSHIICTHNETDVNLYLLSRLGRSVQVNERRTWTLLGSDVELHVRLRHVEMTGSFCAALSTDGKIRVWSRRGDSGRNRRRVGE